MSNSQTFLPRSSSKGREQKSISQKLLVLTALPAVDGAELLAVGSTVSASPLAALGVTIAGAGNDERSKGWLHNGDVEAVRCTTGTGLVLARLNPA